MDYDNCVKISSIVLLVTFILYSIILYYLKPKFVLDEELKQIDNKKLITYSTIVSTFVALLYIAFVYFTDKDDKDKNDKQLKKD